LYCFQYIDCTKNYYCFAFFFCSFFFLLWQYTSLPSKVADDTEAEPPVDNVPPLPTPSAAVSTPTATTTNTRTAASTKETAAPAPKPEAPAGHRSQLVEHAITWFLSVFYCGLIALVIRYLLHHGQRVDDDL
jgi:hypothetical protein